MTVIFTVDKAHAKSYLERQSAVVCDLARIAAKAFVKGRDRQKVLSKKGKVLSGRPPLPRPERQT